MLVRSLDQPRHAFLLLVGELAVPTLLVRLRLRLEHFRGWLIHLVGHDRITRRMFIKTCGPVSDPLSGDEDRHLDVDLDIAHFHRAGMPVADQVADQPPILVHGLGAGAVGDTRGLHDGCVRSHVVDEADKAVIKNRDVLGITDDVILRGHLICLKYISKAHYRLSWAALSTFFVTSSANRGSSFRPRSPPSSTEAGSSTTKPATSVTG
jgi:hypothetical protein